MDVQKLQPWLNISDLRIALKREKLASKVGGMCRSKSMEGLGLLVMSIRWIEENGIEIIWPSKGSPN
jgi:hypothetical protein